MSTKCNCVDKVNAALKDRFGPDASLILSEGESPAGAAGSVAGRPTLGYRYTTPEGVPQIGRLILSKCPFCGVRMEVA